MIFSKSQDGDFVLESSEGSSSVNSKDFLLSILFNKLINVHVASADSDQNLVPLLDLDVNLLLAKLVDAFRLSQEHDVHLFSFWVLVDEVT